MEYKFYKSTVEFLVEQKEENKFHGTSVYTQARSNDGVDWEAKSVESTATGNSINFVLGQVQITLAEYLKSIDGDLFTAPSEKAND